MPLQYISSSIENQLLLSFFALRCDLLSVLRCFTSPQLRSAAPIPRWFDVDLHATIPKTSVCGNEYFACQLADLPATASEVLKRQTLLNIPVLFLQCLNSSQNKSIFVAILQSTSWENSFVINLSIASLWFPLSLEATSFLMSGEIANAHAVMAGSDISFTLQAFHFKRIVSPMPSSLLSCSLSILLSLL